VLELKHITKTFGSVVASNDVSITVHKGTINADRRRERGGEVDDHARRILTSMVKRVDNAVYDVVKEVLGGNFKGGFHTFGLDKDGVAYAYDDYNKPLIPEKTLQDVEAAKAKIVAGEIKVTDAMAN
jgi:basic membrane lipoprotein Med (substrate-binding protein (PBP1-ABC) superfamily)